MYNENTIYLWGALVMICTCEHCGRTQLNIEEVTVDRHVAELCVTCAYVLKQNPERVKQLVRNKTKNESNREMQKQHQLLSGLISVGILGIIAITGIAIVDQLPSFVSSIMEHLSFTYLNQF